MIVFHFASTVSEKNSEVFDGTKDSSAFHLITLVVTRENSIQLEVTFTLKAGKSLTFMARDREVTPDLPCRRGCVGWPE